MKILLSDGSTYTIPSLPEIEPIFLELQLSTDGKTWSSKWFKFMVDTGSVGRPLVLPQGLIEELDLSPNIATVDEGSLADGSVVKEPVADNICIRFHSVPANALLTFLDVPTAISEGDTGLISLDLLAYCGFYAQLGILKFLDFNEKSIAR